MHRIRTAIGPLLLVAAGLLVAPPAAFAEGEVALRRNQVVKTIEGARDAIVSIRTNQIVRRQWFDVWQGRYYTDEYERDGGLGSGVIFHPNGYVITNAHVISRASNILVHVSDGNGKTIEHRAIPQAVDLANDLAILRLMPIAADAPESYKHLRLGRSDDLMLGESVIAMGHPFRLGISVTKGIVSGLGRTLSLPGSGGKHQFDDFIQVDAAINPGNSGGPLFDVTGRWIGVNTAIYNRATGAEGIGFAIPIDRVRSLVANAFKRRLVTGNWVGIEYEEGPRGEAIVQAVYPKGPARASGLREKDVVVAVDGQPTPTLYDLRMQMLSAPLGRRSVSLTAQRDGKLFVARITAEPIPITELSLRHLGIAVQDSEDDGIEGVVITAVRPDGPGQKVKLQQQDVLVALGPWKIKNTDDLLRFLQFVKPGDLVKVRVQRLVRSMRGRAEAKALKGVLRAE